MAVTFTRIGTGSFWTSTDADMPDGTISKPFPIVPVGNLTSNTAVINAITAGSNVVYPTTTYHIMLDLTEVTGFPGFGNFAAPAQVRTMVSVIFGANTFTTANQIPADAFRHLPALSTVTIPGSFTSIGNNAFQNCTNLTSVIFAAGSNITTVFGTDAFVNTTSTADLWAKYGAVTPKPFTANTRFNRSGDVWTRQ